MVLRSKKERVIVRDIVYNCNIIRSDAESTNVKFCHASMKSSFALVNNQLYVGHKFTFSFSLIFLLPTLLL